MKRFLINLLILIILGCGYHFERSYLKSVGIDNIYIEPFKNKTQERGLENKISNALVYEFNMDKVASITRREEAQAILTGKIISYEVYTVAYGREDYTATGRIILRVEAELKKKGTNNVIWKNELTDQEEYMVSSDLIQTQRYRNEALDRIIQRTAERIHDQISTGF